MALRESDLSRLTTCTSEIAAMIEQADSAWQIGESRALDEAHQALEKAYRRCLVLGNAENTALIRAKQAQIAAVKQEYRRASELYADAAATPGLEIRLQWQHQVKRALLLEDLGREFMDNAALEQAIDLYETTILDLAPKTERPEDWATTQNHLGDVLGILAQRHGDTEMLEESVAAFERALEERSRKQTPEDWTTIQNNLAAALQSLGRRKNDAQLLKKSVEAYKNVLREWTREGAPLD